MEQQPQNTRLRNAGFLTFFFSGICTISSGVVVSLLQEEYGFAYGMTGTLLSLLSIGNLLEMVQMPLKKKVTKPAFRRRVFRCSIGFSLQYSGAQRP